MQRKLNRSLSPRHSRHGDSLPGGLAADAVVSFRTQALYVRRRFRLKALVREVRGRKSRIDDVKQDRTRPCHSCNAGEHVLGQLLYASRSDYLFGQVHEPQGPFRKRLG